MAGQNARSVTFIKYIVHKGFSGIELQKYHLKYGQIGKSSTYLKNQVDE